MATAAAGTAQMIGAAITLTALALTIGVAIRAAVPPRSGRRRARPGAIVRALLPRRLIRSASGRADIGWMLFGTLFAGSAVGWALFSSDRITTGTAAALAALFGTPQPVALPGWLASTIMTVAIFIAYEFAYWLDHWLCHRIPALWAFHKVHHGADSLSPLTNFRVHPVDTILFYNIAATLMGVTAALVNHALGQRVAMFDIFGANLLVHVSTITLSYLQHTHLWVRFGARGGRILLGPAHHQIHHSTDPRHFNRNLGGALALWDRLFGTFAMPDAQRQSLRFGVEGMRDPHGAVTPVLMPFVEAVASLGPNIAPEAGRHATPAPDAR
ncbi:sterol desaturase family protein [Sphingobium aquiterrae]|uniref:sterol desaturase family protein n=1 Tax=Sphingobium aquiterrae TaxID=2038656 RepID=UPI003016B4EE